MRPLIFLGSSTNLEVALRICQLCNITVAGIIDGDYYGNTDVKNGIKVIGNENTFDFDSARDQYDFFIGQSYSIQDPRSRKKRLHYIELIDRYSLNCAKLVHPSSEIYDDTELGPGCLVGFCAGIGAHATIGAHSRIDSFAMVGHHASIGKNCSIQSRALISSYCNMGDNVTIMIGATLIRTSSNGPEVGDDAIVHPTVSVARNVDPNEIVSIVGGNTRKIYGNVIKS
jgi:carbonic anhydrase/acetyltransferase-like protein (isoleucine patch superfamily)